MPYILRYNVTTNGTITFTGNTLGLNKVANQNNQGTTGSIGAFSTLNTTLRAGNFPLGTTLDYTRNGSRTVLDIPSGASVLYAELIWSGCYDAGGGSVLGAIGNPISFSTPIGTTAVSPDPATAQNTAPIRSNYVNSAIVTALVQEGGAGTYAAGTVPATVTASNNNDNFAGWTLAVVYSSPFLPSRNISFYVGAEIVNQALGSTTTSIGGFATPVTGTVNGRLLVSASEGDPQILGDQLRFGPTAATLAPISGPNNPVDNFFCSQINNDQGLLDTRGTFGTLNSPPGGATIGARQGWDITNVNVSSSLTNSQTTAVIQATSQGDAYLVNSLGLQVDVNAPFFVFTKSSNTSSSLVGNSIQYTLTVSNTGTAAASLVLLKDNFPSSGSFVPGSLFVNGVNQPGADPVTGVNLGTVNPGQTRTIVYSVQIVSRPAGSAQSNVAEISYNFQSLPGGPIFQGTSRSNGNIVSIGNQPPTTQNYAVVTNGNTAVSGQVTGSDPDGDPLSFTLNSVPTSGTALINPDGTYTYTPNPGFAGNDSFTVLVSDGFGGTAVSTVAVTVFNQPPIANNLDVTTSKNTPLSGQVTATDPNGDGLIYSLNSAPANGTVTINPDGTFEYIPNTDYIGNDSFTFLAADPNGGTAIGAVTIHILNRPPITQNVNLTTPANVAASGQVTASDPDGDPLTFTQNTSPVNGTSQVNPDGTFTYIPNPGFIGTDSFTVLVTDISGGTAVSTVTIEVVNLPPVTNNLNLATGENIPVSGQVTATDPNSDPLIFALTGAPASGTAVVNPDGTFTYTPNPGFVGTDTFNVVVSDGNGGTAISVVTIQVTNQPPIPQNLTLTTAGNTPASGQVVATDPNGDPLTYSLNLAPTNGTAVVNADGTFTYTPGANFSGTDAFTYLVSDGIGGTAIGNVTVNVLNQPPSTSDVSLSTIQNMMATGQVIATDPNGNPLTYTLQSPPVNGTAAVNADGSFTYTPNTGYTGPDSFTVLVSDGFGGTAIATVTINVVNQPPIAQTQNFTTVQNTALSGQIIATDPDGDALAYQLSSLPANGTAVVNPDGTFTYTPATGFVGTDSFTVLVSDGKGGTAVGTAIVRVADQAPIAQDLAITTNVNTPVAGQILATDPDGDPLTYTLSVPPSNGVVVLNPDGTFTYTPNFNFFGIDNFSVLVSDGKGGTATSNVQVGVPVAAPVTSDVTLNTNTNIPVSGQVIATDPQGETLTYTVSAGPANGSVALNSADGTFTYTPNPGFAGTDTFSVLVTNTSGVFVTSVVTINVDNQPPVVPDYSFDTVQNTPVGGQIIATDPDGNLLTYSLANAPTLGTALVNPDGTFTYTPNPGVVGTDIFSVLVSDGRGGTATSVVTVNIINQPPVAEDLLLATPNGVPVSSAVTATDPDGDPLTYTLNAAPAFGTAVVNPDGTFTYTPNAGYVGRDSFTVLVDDGKGGTAIATVQIDVTNSPPIAVGTNVSTTQNTPVAGAVTATDPEGDSLTFSLLTPPANGAVTVNPDGTFTYTPNQGYVGPDSFTVLISDGLGGTAIATATVNVTDLSPVTSDVSISTSINLSVSGQVTATDPEGDLLTFSLLLPPVNGTAAVNPDGTFTYTPNQGYVGPDAFTILVSDGKGGTAVSTVNVQVVNQPPLTQNSTVSTVQPIPVTGAVIATDPDGDPLTYTVQSLPANGTLILNPDGTFTYTPAGGFYGTDFFTVTVSDGRGGVAVAAVTVNVNASPPAVQSQNLETGVNVPISGQIVAVDPNGLPLTYSLQSPPVNGTVVVNPDGTFTYTPNPGYRGLDSFTVQSANSAGGIGVGTITLTIVNLSPTATGANVSTTENIAVSGAISAADPDGDPLTFTINSPPASGTAIVNPDGTFTYTPNTGFVGSDSFTILVSDGNGGTAIAPVTVQVTGRPPVTEDQVISTSPNTQVSGQIIASDPDGDPLIYLLGSSPTSGTTQLNPDGSFTYTPNAGFAGTDSFTVWVSDGNGGTAVSTVTINIPVLPPIVNDVTFTTFAGNPISAVLTAVDPEGSVVTFTLSIPPEQGLVTVNPDESFTYTPGPTFVGTDRFTVIATDANGASSNIIVTIQVITGTPSAPDVSLSTLINTPVDGIVTASAPDGVLIFTLYTLLPANGTVDINPDGTFTYTPNPGFIGIDQFSVIVTDLYGQNAISTVTVTVEDDIPFANPVRIATVQGQAVNGAAIAIDPNGLAFVYSLETSPQFGTVVVNPDGTFTYTPSPDFTGTDRFTIIAINSAGESVSIPVTVEVSASGPVNGPITTDIGIGTVQDQPVSGTILASDPAGLPLIYQLAGLPNSGSVELNPDGSFTYIPNAGFTGTDTFSVRVSDSLGLSALSIVSVVVYPSGNPNSVSIQLTTTVGTPVRDTLPAGQGNYILRSGPSRGRVELRPDGTFVYTPDAGFTGIDEFTIQFTDLEGKITLFLVSVRVTKGSSTITLQLRTEENRPLSGNLNTIGLGLIVTAQIIDNPNNGRLVLNANGTYIYFPDPEFTGPDQFTFIVTDAQEGIYTVIVNVLVYPEGEE